MKIMKKLYTLIVLITITFSGFSQSSKMKMDLLQIDTSYTKTDIYKDSCGNDRIYLKFTVIKQYDYIKLTKILVTIESKTEKIEETYYFKNDKLIYVCLIQYRFDMLFSDMTIYYKNDKLKYKLDGTSYRISDYDKTIIEETIFKDIEYYKNIK